MTMMMVMMKMVTRCEQSRVCSLAEPQVNGGWLQERFYPAFLPSFDQNFHGATRPLTPGTGFTSILPHIHRSFSSSVIDTFAFSGF